MGGVSLNLIRECTAEDLDVLYAISRETYRDTFAQLNTPENMRAYLEEAFNAEKLSCELTDKNSSFYFLISGGKLAGYLKLNEAPVQTDINDPDSIELERIYVKSGFQGGGLGGALMDKVVGEASARGKSYIWLGVWEKNEKALRFYRKSGFHEMGTHSFVMGDEEQKDFILKRDIG